MALVCIFVSMILGMSAAVPQDMSGKMLIFPYESNLGHAKLPTAKENLGAVTVCMRYFTDVTRGNSFFSLATPSHFNDFLIYKTPSSNEISVYVRDASYAFKGLNYQLNQWQSLCSTWDAASGLAQLWLDGKPSTFKYIINKNITGSMSIILGQDQDKYGGGFVSAESFVGMMSDVHMWDYVLPPCLIEYYTWKMNFPVGNVLNWKSLEFETKGRVVVQEEQQSCHNL